jgi:hypothetical protein
MTTIDPFWLNERIHVLPLWTRRDIHTTDRQICLLVVLIPLVKIDSPFFQLLCGKLLLEKNGVTLEATDLQYENTPAKQQVPYQ